MAHEIKFYIKKASEGHMLSELILSIPETSIYIHTNNLEHAEAISQILWAHPKDRFIANIIAKPCPDAVVLIGYKDIPQDRKLIINCSDQQVQPTHIEWVINHNPHVIQLARDRYKAWRHLGHSLQYISAKS